MTTTSTESIGKSSDSPSPTLEAAGVTEISENLRRLLADVFALYVKTKGVHWHITGTHFRDYHLLLDEQAEQIFSMTDDIAERTRKIGGETLRSITDISQQKRLPDDTDSTSAKGMLSTIASDNEQLLGNLRRSHEICARHNDVASTSLIEVWIDQTERRVWFLNSILNPTMSE